MPPANAVIEAACLFHALIIYCYLYTEAANTCLILTLTFLSGGVYKIMHTDLAKMLPDVGMVKYTSNVP